MPTVHLPTSLCLNSNEITLKINGTTLQKVINELFHHPHKELRRLKACIRKNKDGIYHYSGFIVCANNEVITNPNHQFNLQDQITFIAIVSGG